MSAIRWTESDISLTARWHSENATPPPEHVVVVDDRTKADKAYRLARQGTALLWRGDFHNARQLLRAIDRRNGRPSLDHRTAAEAFRLHREHQGRRARLLGRLLVLIEADHTLDLRRAPDVRQACTETYGPPAEGHGRRVHRAAGRAQRPPVAAQRRAGSRARRERLPALRRVRAGAGRVHRPRRGRTAAECGTSTAFDLGTGTGVLAAVLAQRGVPRVVATDIGPRALACAEDNIAAARLRRTRRRGRPSPLPGRARRPGRMQPAVAAGTAHFRARTGRLRPGRRHAPRLPHRPPRPPLNPGGEGWLILSDLAEHLGLRSRGDLLDAIARAGLRVIDQSSTRPRHPRSANTRDPLHAEREAKKSPRCGGSPRSSERTGPTGPHSDRSAPITECPLTRADRSVLGSGSVHRGSATSVPAAARWAASRRASSAGGRVAATASRRAASGTARSKAARSTSMPRRQVSRTIRPWTTSPPAARTTARRSGSSAGSSRRPQAA